MLQSLASDKNPLLKDVRRAASRGGLTEEGFALAEGFHLLEDALASGMEIGTVIAAESVRAQLTPFLDRLEESRLVSVPDPFFSTLTTTEQPQGVMTLVRPKATTLEAVLAGHALAVILDGVQDPGNGGAVIRSAEAFGATGVIFLKGSVNPYNPKCLRGSAGSIFRVPVISGVEDEALFAALAQNTTPLLTAMPRSTALLSDTDFRAPCGVVIGAEGRGVRPALVEAASAFRIPTTGVESLNAAVACGVILYEARRQRSQT